MKKITPEDEGPTFTDFKTLRNEVLSSPKDGDGVEEGKTLGRQKSKALKDPTLSSCCVGGRPCSHGNLGGYVVSLASTFDCVKVFS